jgi:methylmalonyl-CoA mutase
MVQALLDGTIASQLARVQDDRDSSIATRRDPITGVSSFPNLDEKPVDRDQPDAPRPSEAATATEELARTFNAANEPTADGSVIEAAIAAAAADTSIGQLSEALRGTREQVTMPPLPTRREAEAYERLRTASDSWLRNQGRRPQIFLANMGPIPEHKPRASFAKNFFEAGGIETLGNNGFETVDDAVEAFAESDTAMAVICSSDARYPEVVPELAAALDDAGARTILLAGKPGDHETAWRAAGVTGFIHIGCDQVRLLVDLLQEEGVLHV